jgi:Flp pilus assembly protein TadD
MARHLLGRREQGMRRGLELATEVTVRAPGYAPAHALLAIGYSMLTYYAALPSVDGWALVRASAERALALDPDDAEGITAMGVVANFHDRNWDLSLAHFDRALQLAPQDARVLTSVAYLHVVRGELKRAMQLADEAVTLDPLNASLRVNQLIVRYLCGDFPGALEVVARIKDLSPDLAEAFRWEAQTLAAMGRAADAVAPGERAVELSLRHPWALSNHARVLGTLGRFDEARAIMHELDARAITEFMPQIALSAKAWLSSPPSADVYFDHMEKAFEAHEFWLVMWRADAYFREFVDDPRYEEMAKRIGV